MHAACISITAIWEISLSFSSSSHHVCAYRSNSWLPGKLSMAMYAKYALQARCQYEVRIMIAGDTYSAKKQFPATACTKCTTCRDLWCRTSCERNPTIYPIGEATIPKKKVVLLCWNQVSPKSYVGTMLTKPLQLGWAAERAPQLVRQPRIRIGWGLSSVVQPHAAQAPLPLLQLQLHASVEVCVCVFAYVSMYDFLVSARSKNSRSCCVSDQITVTAKYRTQHNN